MIKRVIFWGLLLGFIVSNLLVYQHAKAMTDFVVGGEQTDSPESLSLGDKLAVLATGVTLVRAPLEENPEDHEMKFTSHSMDNGLGYQLNAWHIPVEEATSTVIMFHGYGGNSANLLLHAREFHDMGYNTFVVDFFGSGGSTGSHTTIGVAEAQDVNVVSHYVREKWPEHKIWLFGQSMGAAAITRAVAKLGVQADAIVLESPYDSLLNTAKVRFNSMGLPGSPFAQWLLFWGGFRHGFDPFEMEPAEFAKSITVPTLLLQGGNDPRVPDEQAEAIDAALAGWHNLVIFPEASHAGMLASDAEVWRAEVSNLARQLVPEES